MEKGCNGTRKESSNYPSNIQNSQSPNLFSLKKEITVSAALKANKDGLTIHEYSGKHNNDVILDVQPENIIHLGKP